MKCSGVLAWLLVSRPDEPLPSELVGHVDGCNRCRRRCRRLREAEQDLAAEVPPAPPPDARRRLLQQLPDRGRPSRRLPFSRRQRVWAAVAAALFAGFFVGRSLVPTPATESPRNRQAFRWRRPANWPGASSAITWPWPTPGKRRSNCPICCAWPTTCATRRRNAPPPLSPTTCR